MRSTVVAAPDVAGTNLDFLLSPTDSTWPSHALNASPSSCAHRLMEAECQTPEQMRMFNHVCRYAEMAPP